MKHLKFILLFLVMFSLFSRATTVYEDAEDGLIDGWRIVNDSSNNPFENLFSNSQQSRVIHLNGGQRMLGGYPGTSSAWNNRSETTITWKMLVYDRYTFYVILNTRNGLRYLFYNDLPQRVGFHNGALRDENGRLIAILHGLGGYQHREYKNVWRTYTRDLEADLKDADPDNEIISVDGIMYAGSEAFIDNIMLYNPDETVYGRGEQGVANWVVSDADPAGAVINTADDPENAQGTVISLQGSGQNNAYSLQNPNGGALWNNTRQQILQWKSHFHENYTVYVNVETSQGARTIRYENRNTYTPSGGVENGGQTLWFDLGGWSIIGQNGWENAWPQYNGAVNNVWQTITRDIAQDIRTFQPTNQLLAVNSFEIRGSGLIDDVKMLSRPVMPQEMPEGTYEDAEDGSTSRWQVYDNDPAGATFNNVYDNTRESRVIEFSGSGMENGYEIGSRRGDGQWNNREHNSIGWSMNYGEGFSVYVAIETTLGARYMTYRPTNTDAGLQGSYIYFGLGAGANNGTWQTFTRNLESDLHQFEPNNNLVAIHAFLIRGSGRIDDIRTFADDGGVLEDAEDGNTDGWTVYVNTSGAASIINVESADKQSRVIRLAGDGRSDGYRFDINQDVNPNSQLNWSLNYSETFAIFVSVETANGRRYLTYSPRDDNRGLSGQYVLLGVGANAANGRWQTFNRNLSEDLAGAEAGNTITRINSFMIRGSGEVDDIALIGN